MYDLNSKEIRFPILFFDKQGSSMYHFVYLRVDLHPRRLICFGFPDILDWSVAGQIQLKYNCFGRQAM